MPPGQGLRTTRFTAPFLFLVLASQGPAAGQEVVSDGPEFPACRIERRTVVRIGLDRRLQEIAPCGILGAIPVAEGFLALPWRGDGPMLLSSSGALERMVGRSGRGPGEYIAPLLAARWRGDSILIFDAALVRLSVLAGGGRFARSIPLATPSVESLVALDNGDLVVNAFLTSRAAVGYPLHLLSAAGEVRRSFGSDDPVVVPDGTKPRVRLLATDGRRLWTAPLMGRYLIEEWDPTSGRRVRALHRRASFYPESAGYQAPSPDRAPQSAITGLVYENGLLWALVAVADPEWRRGLSPQPAPGETGIPTYAVTNKNLVFDTVVEAFDARSGRLMASRRYPDHMSAMLSGSRLAVLMHEAADGSVVTERVRLTLERPR